MRISVRPDDSGYHPAACGSGIEVYLDGQRLRFVFTADEELGLAVVADVDDRGRMKMTPDRTDLATKTLRGRVRIEMSDAARRALGLEG